MIKGLWTENDDLERIQCEQVGTAGHMSCGWCGPCDGPRFQCLHIVMDTDSFDREVDK